MFRLYLTRHAETEWNAAGRLQGREDSPLTPQGHAQAQRLAAWARDAGIRHVVTSTLGRARTTAAAVVAAAPGTACTIEPALVELEFGAAAGGTTEDARHRWPEWWAERREHRWTTPWPGGESYADAVARLAAWRSSRAPLPEVPTLIVAHGAMLRALLVAEAGWAPEQALAVEFMACEPVELASGRLAAVT